MIGIAGFPGSGKSTLASKLCHKLPNSVIIPMDGYHIPTNQLDSQALHYRGAEFTINMSQMQLDLQNLLANRQGLFPSFAHHLKDPIFNDIQVNNQHNHVIVEGLYIFLKKYQINDFLDLKIFIQSDRDVVRQRLAKRHIQSGISEDQQSALQRVDANDMKNGDYLYQNSELTDCIIINN